MPRTFLILFSSLAILLVACMTTYDTAIIYHKNFQSGVHPLLRFNGYYTDTLQFKLNQNSAMVNSNPVKPVFFYSNGSAFSVDNYVADYTLLNVSSLKGSWGNYLIQADTIQLEKFQLINSNYTRIILRGIISKDQIHWTSRKDHNESFKPVDYTVFFRPNTTKPDSTKNFIRTKEKYNQ